MTLIDRLSLLTPLDAAALALLVTSWLALGWWIEHPSARRQSVSLIMARFRRAWMLEMITREPRIFDASILSNLRQGTAFFASGCMIAIGGVMALIGNAETLEMASAELTEMATPALIWQIKLLAVVLFLTHAFLKCVWANRLFGYCAVVMAAVPNDITKSCTKTRALQAAEINIRAAINFNRGLRAIYYALGALAWLLGPVALMGATMLVGYLIWQREFASRPREILLADLPAEE